MRMRDILLCYEIEPQTYKQVDDQVSPAVENQVWLEVQGSVQPRIVTIINGIGNQLKDSLI
jgi:hypothetical protein